MLDGLTYEFAVDLATNNDAFLMKEEELNGYRVAQFSYRLAQWEDFNQFGAPEMRGLTFVRHGGGRWERFLMLHKFFNVNQTIGSMYEDVIHKKIISVTDKADGSVIRFIQLPDGTTHAKSKFSFQSEQAVAAQQIYEGSLVLQDFITHMQERKQAAIFELVGPWNQIVIPYAKTHLRLLQIRREDSGRYIDYEDHKPYWTDLYGIIHTDTIVGYNLDQLISRCEDDEGYEGYVVRFDDGQMVKLKTNWYCQLHRLLTENMDRADWLVHAIIDDNIDDAMAQIPPIMEEKRAYIEAVTEVVLDYLRTGYDQCYDIMWNEFNQKPRKIPASSRKDFAIRWQKDPYFPALMRMWIEMDEHAVFEEDFILERIKDLARREVKSLKDGEQFIKRLGVDRETFTTSDESVTITK